jgi:hypothetical protein
MDFVLTTGTAATATMYLVSLFKLGWPAAPSWAVVLCAFLAGEAASFLVSLAQGQVMTSQQAAVTAIAGVFAAATAAGARTTDNKSDEKRMEVQR